MVIGDSFLYDGLLFRQLLCQVFTANLAGPTGLCAWRVSIPPQHSLVATFEEVHDFRTHLVATTVPTAT